MIVTLTPNPSLDRTVELESPLATGQVQRARAVRNDPGGKGVNISRALSVAGSETLAVLPGDPEDPVITGLSALQVPFRCVPVGAALRTNTTITDPKGTTTKINEPGPALDTTTASALTSLVLESSQGATWTALAGSLPPGLDETYYAELISALRSTPAPPSAIAVDASGPALAAAIGASPDLIKPNAEELLELCRLVLVNDTGTAAAGERGTPALEQALQLTEQQVESNRDLVATLVRLLQPSGVQAALVTLGAHGAIYVPHATDSGPVLNAWGPPIEARSTVGAGDAALAGFLTAASAGLSPADCLRHAAAHGRAAAALPGSVMPHPHSLHLDDVVVEEFHPHMKEERP